MGIRSPERGAAERILSNEILAAVDTIADGQRVMLKLTIPAEAGLFKPLVEHPRVLRVLGHCLAASAVRQRAASRQRIRARSRASAVPCCPTSVTTRATPSSTARLGPPSMRFTKRRWKT
jgi:hypothetical protein